jgi:hypothetical protein
MNLAIGNSLQDVVLAQANPSENSVGPDTLGQASRNAEIYTFKDKTHVYTKPALLDFVKNFPGDLIIFTKTAFQKKNLLTVGALVGLSGILVAFDQSITDNTQYFGRQIGLTGNNRMKTAFSVLGQPIEVPHDMDTGMYFIGDGWSHTLIAVSFLGYGLIAGNNRALQTASQLAEGMLTTGFTTQLLKHITGRESPFVATTAGGQWRPFPDQIEYHKHVPEYDAFPSGHLATAMMTVTVIAENYPEKKFIRPLGYTLMTILAFEMVNNGVHWFSDYPIALAIGYSLGKIAVSRGRKTAHQKLPLEEGQLSRKEISVFPFIGKQGVGIALKF